MTSQMLLSVANLLVKKFKFLLNIDERVVHVGYKHFTAIPQISGFHRNIRVDTKSVSPRIAQLPLNFNCLYCLVEML